MKRFRFSLQSVLAIRGAKVDQAEAALAERERSCRDLRERLIRLKDAETETLSQLAVGAGGVQSAPAALSVCRAYLIGVREQIKRVETKLAIEQAEVIKLRQVLLERSKEEQAIEHLKKRKFKVFRGEMAREQQAEIDEVASGRWASHVFRRSGP
jgi:flagellar export protein FliJ